MCSSHKLHDSWLTRNSIGGSREEIYEAWRTAHKEFVHAQKKLNKQKDTTAVSRHLIN
jgi:hypothetical protein